MASDNDANDNKRPSSGGGSPADGLSREENFIAEPRTQSVLECMSASVDDGEKVQGLSSSKSFSQSRAWVNKRDVIPSPVIWSIGLFLNCLEPIRIVVATSQVSPVTNVVMMSLKLKKTSEEVRGFESSLEQATF